MPSLDSRMKVLKGIASENNIVLQIEELESENTEVEVISIKNSADMVIFL